MLLFAAIKFHAKLQSLSIAGLHMLGSETYLLIIAILIFFTKDRSVESDSNLNLSFNYVSFNTKQKDLFFIAAYLFWNSISWGHLFAWQMKVGFAYFYLLRTIFCPFSVFFFFGWFLSYIKWSYYICTK